MMPEDASGEGSGGGGGGIGISAEPPGFLKRLFSVPKNVRRTAAAGDVVVPVIGARDGWGGIRQARLNITRNCGNTQWACPRDKANTRAGCLSLRVGGKPIVFP